MFNIVRKAALISLFSLMVPAFAYAQTPSVRPVDQWCSNVTTRISTGIARWNNNSATKEQMYQNVVNRVQAIINRLNSQGINTTQLVTALQAYNQAILKRHTDAQVWVTDLTNTQSFTCGHAQGQFVQAVKTAHAQRAVVHSDELQVRNIWQTQVRPAIQAVKNIVPSPSPVSTH